MNANKNVTYTKHTDKNFKYLFSIKGYIDHTLQIDQLYRILGIL